MNIYTCKKFTGHYPVGSAAVVVAESAQKAVQILNEQLRREGLEGDAQTEDMEFLPIFTPRVRILDDGNY